MPDQSRQVLPTPQVSTTVAQPGQGGAGRGNDAAQSRLRAATGGNVDELVLGWATQQVVNAAPEELQEYAARSIPIILNQAAREGLTDPNQVAYIIATTEHETKFGKPKYSRSQTLVEDHNPYRSREVRQRGRRGQPDTSRTEWSATNHVNGRQVTAGTESELDERYWDSAYGGRLENQPGTDDASRFRGRGFVQLTGRRNYRERSEAFNRDGHFYQHEGKTYGGRRPIDLQANPEHVNENPDLAAQLLVTGARDGSFTSRKLSDYIPEGSERPDFVNARRVINGDVRENGASIAALARRYAVVLGRAWPKVFNSKREGGPR
jgi:predicted chitinase